MAKIDIYDLRDLNSISEVKVEVSQIEMPEEGCETQADGSDLKKVIFDLSDLYEVRVGVS